MEFSRISIPSFSRIFPNQGSNSGLSCTAGRFFTIWATREALGLQMMICINLGYAWAFQRYADTWTQLPDPKSRIYSFPKWIPLRTDLPVHADYRIVTQSCLTHCNAMHCSLPGSSVHEISQTRLLEWVAMSFSRGSSQPREQTHVTCIGRWILYYWTTREAHPCRLSTPNPPLKTIPFLLDQIKGTLCLDLVHWPRV